MFKPTATEVLIETMEKFSSAEARDLIVIYTDEKGDLCYNSNINSTATKIGLLKFTEQLILEKAFRQYDDPDS